MGHFDIIAFSLCVQFTSLTNRIQIAMISDLPTISKYSLCCSTNSLTYHFDLILQELTKAT